MRYFLLIVLFFITACTPASLVNVPSQILTIYATSATEGWLAPVYDCAAEMPGMYLSRILDSASADISLRRAAQNNSEEFVYQIGEVELVVEINVANPVIALSESQMVDIYEGKIRYWSQVGGSDAEIELWIYEQEDDLMVALSEIMLRGRSLSSLARQASNENLTRQAVSESVNALGILSRSQRSDNTRVLHTIGKYPVLMVAKTNPQGPLLALVACLQGK